MLPSKAGKFEGSGAGLWIVGYQLYAPVQRERNGW